ncbi:hypothetical protein GCM10011588_12800 [Nocardia jinanensis]|uniref:Uncharacterized protein n=1 Tax=Nocardia jinanensis TaxID=382504 RepID=A0A917VMN9_9NOCA|nr:hypothetical protein GCM10011588_12800 [Nocardia jinanensis]
MRRDEQVATTRDLLIRFRTLIVGRYCAARRPAGRAQTTVHDLYPATRYGSASVLPGRPGIAQNIIIMTIMIIM